MIIEILQLADILLNKEIHLLIGFFILFVIFPVYLIKRQSVKYNVKYNAPSLDVTVVVPVHYENYDIFEKCMNSIRSQDPKQLIVTIDSNDQKLINIATKYGAEILKFNTRVGKRRALADAWKKANNNIIVHVDSDIVLDINCLKEITKPFVNQNVVGVSTEHVCVNNGSNISYVLYCSIELARVINEKALDGNLIVVDGKCSAWRRDFLLSIIEKFTSEYWMNTKCEIGDDRFISREAIKHGFNTVHSHARIFTQAPNSFRKFVKQQIRWRRSGTKFWIKDLMEGVYPSKLYVYKCMVYYLSPVIFPLVIILDMIFLNRVTFDTFDMLRHWEFSMIMVVVGPTMIVALIQVIYFGRVLFPKYIVLQALLGLFVMLPISIYGILTIKRQNLWMTRTYESGGIEQMMSTVKE